MNLYTYCHNEPIRYFDPTGHWENGDEKYDAKTQAAIAKATTEYYEAKAKGDTAGMLAANTHANLLREFGTISDSNVNSTGQSYTNTITSSSKKDKNGNQYMDASDWGGAVTDAMVTAVNSIQSNTSSTIKANAANVAAVQEVFGIVPGTINSGLNTSQALALGSYAYYAYAQLSSNQKATDHVINNGNMMDQQTAFQPGLISSLILADVGRTIHIYAYGLGYGGYLFGGQNYAVFFNGSGEYYFWGSVYAKAATRKNPLPDDQCYSNAAYIYCYLRNQDWSDEAVFGLLGNIQQESGFNPGIWQSLDNTKMGYGIVQFSPPTKFFSWAGIADSASANKMASDNPQKLMELQLRYLLASAQPGQGIWLANDRAMTVYGSPYLMAFSDFAQSNNPVSELALVFHGHYERSSDNAEMLKERIGYAEHLYQLFINK